MISHRKSTVTLGTNLIVYSVQSSNRKLRMRHYFNPFKDTCTLVEVIPPPFFSLIFGQNISMCTMHINVHTRVMALCIYSNMSHSDSSLIYSTFYRYIEVVFPRLCGCLVHVRFILINVICMIIQPFYL